MSNPKQPQTDHQNPSREFLKARSEPFVSDQQKGIPSGPVETPPPDDAERIALPAPDAFSCGQMPLREVIGQRRSRRRFSSAPLTIEELAFVCWATLGMQKVFEGGHVVWRTVPSAGARHALQLYLAVGNVQGLPKGLYRYLALEHALAALKTDNAILDKTARACFDQRWMARAAAVLFFSVVPYRMEWRYGPASPKLIALDAGHACQNTYLAAESLGAGACAVAAYDQTRVDQLVGLDGNDEFVIYLATVGRV